MRDQCTSVEILRKEYGDFFNLSPLVDFEFTGVPDALYPLIPYARFWGISDDWQREQLAIAAPDSVRRSFKQLIEQNDDALDDWLAGEEAVSTTPTDAYVAFSAMRMCADFM